MKYLKEIFLSISCLTISYAMAFFSNKQDTPDTQTAIKSNELLSSVVTSDRDTSFNFNKSAPHLLSGDLVKNAKQLIQDMPESQVVHYLTKAFPDTDLSHIQDKKGFSERLLEELSDINQPSSIYPTGLLSVSQSMDSSYLTNSENIANFYKNQQIFAHYDTLGKTARSDQVFVKWINQDSGEVLLFTPQKINKYSDQNWVSYSPPDGWKPGHYAIEYYEFNDRLTPIAKTSYTIRHILD